LAFPIIAAMRMLSSSELISLHCSTCGITLLLASPLYELVKIGLLKFEICTIHSAAISWYIISVIIEATGAKNSIKSGIYLTQSAFLATFKG
jgi:hypothetical protein